MSPCGRRRFSFFKRCIIVGVEICIIFSILLLIELLRHDNTRTSRTTRKVNSKDGGEPHDVFTRRRIDLLQRGLLYKNDSAFGFDSYDVKSKTFDVAHRVFDIIPQPEDSGKDSESHVGHKRAKAETQLKYLFVLHHYEQLAKTTENLLQLAAAAKTIGRVIVEPFVRDSRMCGLRTGWFGEPRSQSRLFHPLSLYFNVPLMNSALAKSGYSTMVKFETYKNRCAADVAETNMVHFVYSDQDIEVTTRKWFNLSAHDYAAIVNKLKARGWCECSFIDRGLNISTRIGDVRLGRQICVDSERIKNLAVFENEILLNRKCVVIVHWRGIGRNRTHFEPAGHVNTREVVHSLRHSDFILQGVEKFLKDVGFISEPYLAIHIRSERQIQWYGVDRLIKCVEVLITIALKIKRQYRLNKVFLATDFSAFGSDTLFQYSSQNTKELAKKLKTIQNTLEKKLTPIQFSPTAKGSLVKDKGVVAITEMNVLYGGSHLITIGSGTFQQWIVDVFIDRHSKENEQHWAVTRICNNERRKKGNI